jgi:arylsulfatase A-like enzyme
MYAHSHTVVDNSAPEPDDIIYFPQLLQKAGYQTAFFGKWHMGNEGDQMQNLIADPQYRALTRDLSAQVFGWLENTRGMQIPLKRNVYPKIDHKYKGQF